MRKAPSPRVVLMAGGVGGARMAVGLQSALPAESLTVVVNVGDDDSFHGLRVCPDLDTVLYTLSGQVHANNAWGIAGDTRRALDVLTRLGAHDTWMTLGDADLGLHLYRTSRLAQGATLTEVMDEVANAFGVGPRVLPVTEHAVSTRIRTSDGELRFQEWFVKHRCAPAVHGLRFDGVNRAAPTNEVAHAIRDADLIIFAPSNPWLSILPMLRVSGVERSIRDSTARRLVVSPLIGGQAVKGPLVRLMRQLMVPSGNTGIAQFYAGLADGIVIDHEDQSDADALESQGFRVLCTSTRIAAEQAAGELAAQLVEWARELPARERA